MRALILLAGIGLVLLIVPVARSREPLLHTPTAAIATVSPPLSLSGEIAPTPGPLAQTAPPADWQPTQINP